MKDLGFDHKKEVFKVPENYFEKLEKAILTQTVDREEKKSKVVPIEKKRSHFYFSVIGGIAASLLLLAGFFFNSSQTLTENDIITAENSIYSTFLVEDTFSDIDLLAYETDSILE